MGFRRIIQIVAKVSPRCIRSPVFTKSAMTPKRSAPINRSSVSPHISAFLARSFSGVPVSSFHTLAPMSTRGKQFLHLSLGYPVCERIRVDLRRRTTPPTLRRTDGETVHIVANAHPFQSLRPADATSGDVHLYALRSTRGSGVPAIQPSHHSESLKMHTPPPSCPFPPLASVLLPTGAFNRASYKVAMSELTLRRLLRPSIPPILPSIPYDFTQGCRPILLH